MARLLGRALIWACVIATAWYIGQDAPFSRGQHDALRDVARHYQALKAQETSTTSRPEDSR